MFERYTDRARRVIVIAQEEARAHKHSYIGTEHLLLGLTNPVLGGLTPDALAAIGLTPDKIRAEIRARVKDGEHPIGGHIPFTPRHKKVLEGALREALNMGDNYVSPDHLLLSLVNRHLGDGMAGEILLEATPEGAAKPLVFHLPSETWHLWKDYPAAASVPPPGPKHSKLSVDEFKALMHDALDAAQPEQLMLAAHALGFELRDIMDVAWKTGRVVDVR